ncbi:MAG TPA: SRPBCC family protein [Polyangiaceae bacterium]|nr:SRPBCC family protein [Polyangiaceae bacterium]
MSQVIHDTFTIERTVAASPDRVFEALANPEMKAKWFAGPPSWKLVERTQDFRVGGHERVSGKFESGMTSVFDADYHDIVPNERVVYVYEMTVNGRKISTSLATFEIQKVGAKTKIVLTEQGAYYEDPDMAKYAPQGQAASRREGTEGLMDRIAALFAS